MDYITKEMLVNRIVSGVNICRIDDTEYILRNPTRMEKCRADMIYLDTLRNATRRNIPTEDYINKFMNIKGLWSDAEEEELKRLTEEVDALKVSLYENFDKDLAAAIRSKLNGVRDGITSYHEKKHKYHSFTDVWIASCARQRYLISCVADCDSDTLITAILTEMAKGGISDTQFRELARTDPWRSIWMAKDDGVFGVPSCDMTPEQQRLFIYSVMYDRIYEHPERPSDEIMEDDDALDGWKIVKHKESGKARAEKEISNRISNQKIASSDEVFVVANNEKEATAINNMNDTGAKMIKKDRERKVKEEGQVSHQDFLDQRLLIQSGFKNRV